MKKLISMILVVSMILCMSVTAFATNNTIQEDTIEVEISSVSAYGVSDIDSIDAVTKRGIQEQLEEQNALEMLDIHEYIYRTTNPSLVPYGSDDEYTNVYAPYGGMMEYQTRISGGKVNIANTYLDRNNTLYFVLEQQEMGVGDILLSIVGYIPLVGPLASTIANAKAIVNSAAATSIKNAGGYAQITVTEYNDGITTSVGGWTRHPYMYLYDLSAFDIRTTVFEEYDPFE